MKHSSRTHFFAKTQASAFYPWLIWALGAGFFFSEYFARVAPSIMVPELMSAFNVTALALGAIAGFFYYAYISMQLVVGVLVDRFGPHKLLTVTAALCASGAFMFAKSTHLSVAELSRFIMGLGAAFAFVGTLKLATLWFPARRFGLLAGMTQALGMLGAAVGEGPLAAVVSHMGWRATLLLIGGVLMALALLIGLVVRDRPATESNPEPRIFESLSIVVKNPQTWWVGLCVGLLYAPTEVFGELWGASYLHRVYGLYPELAATAISFIFLGWAVGGPLFGGLSDYLRCRKRVLMASCASSALLISIVLYFSMPLPVLFIVLFVYGMGNFGVATCYAIASEINPKQVAGTSIAFTNMASILIGGAFQPIVGWFLDLEWKGTISHGARVYSAANFHHALVVVPLFAVGALFVSFFIKETHCQSVIDE